MCHFYIFQTKQQKNKNKNKINKLIKKRKGMNINTYICFEHKERSKPWWYCIGFVILVWEPTKGAFFAPKMAQISCVPKLHWHKTGTLFLMFSVFRC